MDKKRKGILKKSSSTRVDGSPGGGEEGGEGTHQLHWDEEGIAEYDKQRGHKMKVSEPKTPYSYDIPSDEEDPEREVQMEKITADNTYFNKVATKLSEHEEEVKKGVCKSRSFEMDSDEAMTEDEKKKKEAFRKKQKLHYKNEYKNAKILLKKGTTSDEDES